MNVDSRTAVVRVDIALTPDEAMSLKNEVNEISGMTPLTANELNEKYPVTSQLLSELERVTAV